MYNENVMKWCCFMPELYSEDDIDLLIDQEEEVIIVDDSEEWYNNIYASEADG